jgi:cysteine desulfurase
MGRAAELLVEALAAGEADRLRALRDHLLDAVSERIPGTFVNGSLAARTPTNLNLSFPGVEAAALLMALRDTVALSTGSAGSSESLEPSHVLRALGDPVERAQTSVRIGLSRFTTPADIDRVIDAFAREVPRLRALGPLVEA